MKREGKGRILKLCEECADQYRGVDGVSIDRVKAAYDCKTMAKDMVMKLLDDDVIRQETGGHLVVMVTHVDKFYFHFPEFMRETVVSAMPLSAKDITHQIAGQLPGYVYYRAKSSDLTIASCLDLFNRFMDVPIIVQAYAKACRCASFRNRKRCPTAEVALVGKDRNWSDTFQAIARPNGNNLWTLKDNRCPHFSLMAFASNVSLAKEEYNHMLAHWFKGQEMCCNVVITLDQDSENNSAVTLEHLGTIP